MGVVVAEEPTEPLVDVGAGQAAERVGEVDCSGALRSLLGRTAGLHFLRAGAGCAHCKKVGSDIHEPGQYRLAPLESRSESHDGVEQAAAQAARRPVDVAHVFRQRSKLAVPRPASPAEPPGRIPHRVVECRLHERPHLRSKGGPRVGDRPGHLEVGVHCLARDEQPHDFTGALEDQVDSEITHHALDRLRSFSPFRQARRGLIATAPAELHRFIDDAPTQLGVPHLRDRGFEANVVSALVRHERGQFGHSFHSERVSCHPSEFLGNCVVLADGFAPLHALLSETPRHLKAHFRGDR